MVAKIAVKVKPRARAAGLRVDGDAVEIAVREPALEGRATEACRRMLAEALRVPLRDVRLQSGARSRHKIFFVDGIDEMEMRRRLRS